MIRILYFTDSHIRGNSPRARVDHYPDALKAKLCWMFARAKQENVDAVVCGGDMFDRPDTAYAIAGEFAAVLAESPAPIYVCPGNHEIYGYNLDTLPRSILGFLAQIGLVHILTRKPLEFESEGVKVSLTGQGFHHNIDRGTMDYMTGLDGTNGYRVHVVHGMLVEKPLPYEVAHTLVEKVVTDADVVLSGHEHIGYGLRRRSDGIWFCNPGALGRLSANMEEMHRPVRVALFTFAPDGISGELVKVDVARPGTEVLSREHLAQQAEQEERINRFLSLLAAEGESKFLEVREIVDDIARREMLPGPVVADALNRITRARESLSKAL